MRLFKDFNRARIRMNRESMLNFDIHVQTVAGFSFHWCWVWLLFWSSLFYAVHPAGGHDASGALSVLEPLWVYSFAGMLVTLAVLFFAARRIRPLASKPWLAIAAGAATAVGTLMVSQLATALAPGAFAIVYAVGALLTGIGSAVEVVLWGELLTRLGSRQTIVYFVMSTVLSATMYLLVVFMPAIAGQLIAAVLPAAEMALFVRQSKRETVPARRPSGAKAADGRKLAAAFGKVAALSLFFGMTYGVMKGFFAAGGHNQELIFMRDIVNVVALILGSVAIFITMTVYRMDFRRLTYQVALPLLAAGFLFYPLSGPASLIGFGLHQAGYQYFYTIIWAMWPVMAQWFDEPDAQFACMGLLGVQCGQFFGSVAGAGIMEWVATPYALAMTSSVIIFIILLVAIFAFGSTSSSSSWLLFRPFEQEQGSVTKFRRAMQRIAESRGLTPREAEVFELLAHGRNRAFISEKLVISEGTAKAHIRSIYRKLGVHTQQALIDQIELDAKSQ